MGKFNRLIRWAIISGPVVLQTVQKYGPVVKNLIDSNPDAVDKVTGKLKSYQKAKKKTGVEGAAERISILKDQVTYLYGSANTPEVATQASNWKSELNKLEVSLPLVDVMSVSEKRKRLKDINDKIDRLSSEILAAVVEDDIQDADIVDEDFAS